ATGPRLSGADRTRDATRRTPGLVNERAQRMDERLEPWFLVAALLVIPDVVIEATTQGGAWSQVALVLNWVVWLTFAVGLGWTALLADARWRWLRERPLDIAIVV